MRKTCKNDKKHNFINAKKGTQLKCRMKTCRAKLYRSVYGESRGRHIRCNKQLFY